jgi:hypothetical protein
MSQSLHLTPPDYARKTKPATDWADYLRPANSPLIGWNAALMYPGARAFPRPNPPLPRISPWSEADRLFIPVGNVPVLVGVRA